MVLLIYSCRESETCGFILKTDWFVVRKHVPDHNVWVSDSQQPFVEQEGMDPDVLYMKEKQPLVFPCRATHPNVTAALVKVSAGGTRHSIAPNTFSAVHHLSRYPTTTTTTGPSPLRIIHNIVLILAAITLWRVCPFVCVHQRICVKVCADVFVSVGA